MEPDKPKIKEYAGGWITEREDAGIPGFLKLSYIAIAGGALAYFFIYMYGEVNNAGRGYLVRAMNAATEASAGLMYAIAALIAVFGVVVVSFAFGKPDHD
jgi:choline-glycine betaine transporter